MTFYIVVIHSILTASKQCNSPRVRDWGTFGACVALHIQSQICHADVSEPLCGRLIALSSELVILHSSVSTLYPPDMYTSCSLLLVNGLPQVGNGTREADLLHPS